MKDSRIGRSGRDRSGQLSPDAERLVAGALGLSNSGSRAEDDFWEAMLQTRLEKMLEQGNNQGVFDALDRLNQTDLEAYGALVEAVENAAEAVAIEFEGELWDVLLLAAPVVSWTRFKLAHGPIASPAVARLTTALQAEVLASGTRIAVSPYFYSIDHLPREFSELRKFTRKLGLAALKGQPFKASTDDLPEVADMLADVRFIIAGVAVPRGKAIFRWQELESTRQISRVTALEKWIAAARPVLEALQPGCGFECLLPDAYHLNLRESDRRVRPHGLRAAIGYLTQQLNILPETIRAYIAGFGSQQIEEYRIGLSLQDSEQVAQGVVWPIYAPEELNSDPSAYVGRQADSPSALESIKDLLKECGVTEIRVWPELAEPEFCEDCGAPLFPNIKGDMVHTEMPEDFEPSQPQLH